MKKLSIKLFIIAALILANGAYATSAVPSFGQQDGWTCGHFGWFESCESCPYICECGDDTPLPPAESCP